MAGARPQIIASVVLAYLQEVEKRGLLERVRADAGPDLRQILAYDRVSETSGTMRIEAVAPLSPAYWVTWEGPLAWICDACKAVGTVKREPLAGASAAAKFGIEWAAQ